MSPVNEGEFASQVDLLAGCRNPYLIGVRHHSAALARAIVLMLDAYRPSRIFLEMPTDFADWIQYLSDDETIAPVAISAADSQGNVSFYPLADFSPELVAIRWGSRHNIPVIPIDLSAGAQVHPSKLAALNQAMEDWQRDHPIPGMGYETFDDKNQSSSQRKTLSRLFAKTHSEDTGQLWERWVETPGMLSDPESIRRAALLFGWAVREDRSDISIRDMLREAAMREAIRKAPDQSVAIVGSYHASALLPSVFASTQKLDSQLLNLIREDQDAVGVSLVGYSFEQLDERSGYPAGVRDPVWHDRVVATKDGSGIDQVAIQLVVDICRALRSRGHVAGTPDATEIVRMMRDLAKVRGLPIAGRGELLESIQSCLVQGALNGRAREVARAVESVLIGTRQGRVTERTPRCGLALSLDELFRQLKFPTKEAKEFRLDVLRDPRDRARAVVLRQLCAANIPYARRIDTIEQGNRENLIEVWETQFHQGTAATIESLSRYGVLLPQVLEGLIQLRSPNEDSEDWTPSRLLQKFKVASECGLHRLTRQVLDQLTGTFLRAASLIELVDAASRLGRIVAGHVPGLPQSSQEEYAPYLTCFRFENWVECLVRLVRTSLDRLAGLSGSNQESDVEGICELAHWLRGSIPTIVSLAPQEGQMDELHQGMPQLISWCRQTLMQGSDRMQGASIGLLCLFEESTSRDFASLLSGWIDDAIDSTTRAKLRDALSGAVHVLLPKMQSDTEWLMGVHEAFQTMSDAQFLKRLPPLRGAFHILSPADRQRILDLQLDAVSDRGVEWTLGQWADDEIDDPGHTMALLREADLAGQLAVQALLPINSTQEGSSTPEENADLHEQNKSDSRFDLNAISLADRWRMVMGIAPAPQSRGFEAATTLDHLYGVGKGEGASARLSKRRPGGKGGAEQPTPTVAEWADDLEALFGSDICQEVLGASAAGGNLGAIAALDPDTVIPSLELLQQVLSLAGGTSEGKTQRLRQIAKRITEQLAQNLAVRLRPHTHGLSVARPTRRRNRRLNVARTIRGNLANPIRRADGRNTIIAKNLVYNSASKREMDWHLTFVVDVSGSMTTSVVYSALCAAIFSELPALSVRFLAFSTQVLDFSHSVSDPLTLLLEVQVGGGTHIGLGLRHARAGLRVPTRSLVVLVTDFEEGVSQGEMIAETRALVESGAKCIGLAALDDQGVARYHQGCAQMMVSAGMPVAAVSPEKLAQWVGDQIRGDSK